MRRGEFKRQNSLKSQQTPNFNSTQSQPRRDQEDRPMSDTIIETPDLPRFKAPPRLDSSTATNHTISVVDDSPSNVGDSSSLFDVDSPASVDDSSFYPALPTKAPASIPYKMAREASPAKVPQKPARTNEQPNTGPYVEDTQPVRTFPTLGTVPRFGEPSLPQSPLNRKTTSNRESLERKILLQPRRPQESSARATQSSKDFAKDAVRSLTATSSVNQSSSSRPSADPVPIGRPTGPTYTTTRPVQPQAFGSLGNTYGGFTSTTTSNRPHNFIDLTTSAHRDLLAPEPYTFVDPTKAAADLKALLEGAIEDDDDKPRTRSRRKKKPEGDADGLADALEGLTVSKEEDDEDEEEVDDGSVDGIKVKLLPHQIEGLSWMQERELGTRKKGTVPKGGILADDMGLGKTLQSISLIITNPKAHATQQEEGARKISSAVDKCTLVVAPLALIRQWEIEIKDKVASSHALRVCVHHGPQRTKRFQDLKKYDVVITTYQILVSEHGNSSPDVDGVKTGCFGLHWYRVILDEAHTIKNRNAKATQACYALRSEYRWCLTGTPMQNNLDELQSLIKFLRIKPYDDLKEWKDQIDRPMKNGRGDVAIKRLQTYLRIFMKRRTKDILKKAGALNPGGKPSAPGEASTTGFKVTERRIEKVFCEFTAQERHFYERLEQRTDKSLEQMMGGQKVNYASALTLLLRLRQACNHPKLVAGKLGKDQDALAVDSSSATRSPSKKVSTSEVDDIADLFGNLGVGSKSCDVCQLELSKELSADGAIRCEDCEADLAIVATKHKGRKDKKHKRMNEFKPEISEPTITFGRKPRNRNVVLDSDDEEEGEWIVGKDHHAAAKLGRVGGTDDEDAEGTGISLGAEDSDSDASEDYSELPDVRAISSQQRTKKERSSLNGSIEDSDSGSESEVEDELASSGDEAGKLATIITSTKITHLLKILDNEADEHKFIVFSQFTSMLDLIEPFLKRDGYKFTRYDGSMKNDLREASLNRLRNDAKCRILLCSLKCGSLGLNLTAATRVVILEPFWNPFVEEQAIDRVHRLTQKTNVIVYKITIKNSVEERILLLQEKKRELANQAIEGGKNQNAGKLGMREIMMLFRRDAEHAPPARGDATSYTIGEKINVLSPAKQSRSSNREIIDLESGSRSATPSISGQSSREGSVVYAGERRLLPTKIKPKPKEDSLYGRRW